MSPEQVVLIQESFAKVAPNSVAVADLFYARLFALDPSLRPLFPESLHEQGKKLMTMLGTVVKGLNNLSSIVPVAQSLGRRHVAYQVKPAHYATVGSALLWTLGQGLGDEFTEPVQEAWAQAYGILSTVMIEASHTVAG